MTMTPVELTARREALGLSNKALSEAWNIRYQNLARWEYGKNHPRDWDWMAASLTDMENYQIQLVEELVEDALEVYESTGEAALVTYNSRGAFYYWKPEARNKKWVSDGYGVPVELHRAAVARAAIKLRNEHGIENITISPAPYLGGSDRSEE